ncbi:PREDICTED: uncharacterized protein LOC105139149 [Populus euphratica]|uniref:Uncharacterized protein LOC105119815 n=1 Tax=Populus euphratica TaxID=75702 RepID=A0AAJ6V8G8_POPEU|nr:PREDICTED: uncharacterized protein LOC105119815 [Populus euphratica]XP_011043792.1 PREDICTED: uncharacterized protein LOC105139149 [Populus euphratica]
MLLWCGSCTRRCPTFCQEDSVSCSICGKVLSMLSWHRRLDTRNPRFKRTCRGRRKKIQINDDESCVTNQEASVNIDEALSSTAEKPVVMVKDKDDAVSSTAEKPVLKVKDGGAD